MTAENRVQEEINKRLTMNLLIQGASMHAMLTLHHLVCDELNAINNKLIPLYDRLAVSGTLSLWRGEQALISGRASRFWSRTDNPQHPFHHHLLLARHGGTLAEATRQHTLERAKLKKVWRMPGFVTVQMNCLALKAHKLERDDRSLLEYLACLVTSQAWGIEMHQLRGSLTTDVRFGVVREQPVLAGRIQAAIAPGWSGVEVEDSELRVTATGMIWPVLASELVKGTAELVSLHGLNTLDEDCYEAVMAATDRVDFEPWHMQAGADLWRRLLAVAPSDQPIANVLMNLARLSPQRLEAVMLSVIEEPEAARSAIAVF